MSASKNAANNGTSAIGPETVVKTMQKGMANAMAVPQKVMEANLETGAELLNFMSRRMKCQSELWDEVSHCHGVDGAMEAQRRFMSGISKDYTEEMAHLTDILRKNLETVTSVISLQMRQADAAAPQASKN